MQPWSDSHGCNLCHKIRKTIINNLKGEGGDQGKGEETKICGQSKEA